MSVTVNVLARRQMDWQLRYITDWLFFAQIDCSVPYVIAFWDFKPQ